MWGKEKKYSISDDAFNFFFDCIGYFNHYEYFTKELWRKVKEFKNTDEAEVKCAFLSLWCANTLGIKSCPVGMGWSCPNVSDETFEDYKKEWMPLYKDFSEWCTYQR